MLNYQSISFWACRMSPNQSAPMNLREKLIKKACKSVRNSRRNLRERAVERQRANQTRNSHLVSKQRQQVLLYRLFGSADGPDPKLYCPWRGSYAMQPSILPVGYSSGQKRLLLRARMIEVLVVPVLTMLFIVYHCSRIWSNVRPLPSCPRNLTGSQKSICASRISCLSFSS